MRKSDSLNNFQQFTIRPAGNSSAQLSDMLDLDDIFKDDFFPPELDFSQFSNQEQAGLFSSMGLDTFGPLPGESISARPLPAFPAAMQSTFVPPSSASVVKNYRNDDKKVIMIPPTMPVQLDSIPLPKSATKSSASKKKDPRIKHEDEDQIDALSSKKARLSAGQDKEDEYDDDDDEPLDATEHQKIERRERNREHAKRSRIRKRMLLETLQDQLSELRDQNIKLRRLVARKIPERATTILAECTTEESDLLMNLYSDEESGKAKSSFKPSRLTSKIASDIVQTHKSSSVGLGAGLSGTVASQPRQHAKILMEPDFRLIQSLITSQQNFVLSDPSLPDNPIVYVSDGFCRLTGYKRQDCLGRNCRFLQGPGTDQAAVDVIRQGVYEGRDISVCLLNYRADGSPFWNQFFLGALKDSDGQVVNYVGVQCEVNTIPVEEIKDRVKKLPMPDDI